jgi:outer membrane immunogenic protein
MSVGTAATHGGDSTVAFLPNDPVAFEDTCGGFLAPPPFGTGIASTCPGPASLATNGWLGGLQAGYNWQINRNWLVGLETDFDWSHINGSGSSNVVLEGEPSNFQAAENVSWFGTVRARVGFLPVPTLLLYATGGLGYGRFDENVALNAPRTAFPFGTSGPGGFTFTCVGGPDCFLGGNSHTAAGWTVGAGFEYALWNHISYKAEYLYVDLGSSSANVVAQSTAGFAPPPPLIPSSFTASYGKTDFNVVRAGINYKFFGP